MIFFFFVSSFASTFFAGAYTIFICVKIIIFTTMTRMKTCLASGHYLVQSHFTNFFQGQQIIVQAHPNIFLIIFLLLYFIEELVGIFCPPCSTIFYVPFRSLHFPVRSTIFHSERRYVPYTSVVRLCCKIAIIESNYVSSLMFVRYFRMIGVKYITIWMCKVNGK